MRQAEYSFVTCCVVYIHISGTSNKGRVDTSTDVHYWDVVLYWGILVKHPYFCIVSCIGNTLHYSHDRRGESKDSVITILI